MLHVNLTAGTSLFNLGLEESASFDREGRLLYYHRRQETFRRSLASEVFRRAKESGRRWDRLTDGQALEVLAAAYDLASRARSHAGNEAAARLDEEILPWTLERLAGEASRFAAVYRPVSILPPDCYQTVVVQATEGCTWNRCTFCSFYMDRHFKVKSPVRFSAHLDGVLDLVGRGLSWRRGVFLADGNALAVGLSQLGPLVALVRERLPGHDLFGFVDLFSGERRPLEHWLALSRLGLRRVYVGMETGADELLAFVNKPGSRQELLDFVTDLKRAGLAVGLIVIVGLGGCENRTRHREETLRALESMALGRGDLVYLSPLVTANDDEYSAALAGCGWSSLTAGQVERELERWQAALRRAGIRSSRYDIREFVY